MHRVVDVAIIMGGHPAVPRVLCMTERVHPPRTSAGATVNARYPVAIPAGMMRCNEARSEAGKEELSIDRGVEWRGRERQLVQLVRRRRR